MRAPHGGLVEPGLAQALGLERLLAAEEHLPTRQLAAAEGRDLIVSVLEATTLISSLGPRDQAALGLAVYAGLRLGELLALDWASIDFPGRILRVERSWDHASRRYVAPKSSAARRSVPVKKPLAELLVSHSGVMGETTNGLLFPGTAGEQPLHPTSIRGRITKAWRTSGLEPLGFHEARHTAASLFIAAGWNAKTVATYMGHASVTITFDRYGHLFPGAEDEAGELLDAFLARPAR